MIDLITNNILNEIGTLIYHNSKWTTKLGENMVIWELHGNNNPVIHQVALTQDLFNNTKGTFQFLQNFQLWFNLIFNEKIIQYSRTFALQIQTSWNQAHAPLLVENFPKTPRTWSEASWFDGSHNYKTKQKKLPFLIYRYAHVIGSFLSIFNFLKCSFIFQIILKFIFQLYNSFNVYINTSQLLIPIMNATKKVGGLSCLITLNRFFDHPIHHIMTLLNLGLVTIMITWRES